MRIVVSVSIPYCIKPCHEVILLSFAEKTELFLELYGNLQVRAQSLEYVEKMSTEFIQ